MLPKITVITVCRNAADLIEATMLSVLNQTYPNIEYIVIDGNSTDGTQAIAERYANHLAYYVSEPDAGIYNAMNKALLHATGEWVNFMNAGDSFVNSAVLAHVFGEHEYADEVKVIGGNTCNVFAHGTEMHFAEPANVIPYRLPFSHQASFVRRQYCAFDEKYRIAADYNLFYNIYLKYGAEAFCIINSSIACYEMIDSTTFQNIRKTKREYLQIQAKHISWWWIKEVVKYILFV